MMFCKHCGAQMEEGIRYCPSCGKAVSQDEVEWHSDAQAAFENLADTPDTTSDYTPAEVESGKGIGCLSYLGILVLIPFFAEKGNRFVRYHARQGLVLFLVEVAYWVAVQIVSAIVLSISWRLAFVPTILSLVGLVFLALSILGLVNVFQGRAKELPLVGKIKIFH
ncbi:zinc-ribbon domain-containing protein [Curtanaerobium respiraculi]|uniref:zinc-ribbon domain-containing protein n=1 Tax=Curtanaerobium respiraculi TaxID=2949669 RepID=UPI0024B39E47|nr:zinc-ribbon domain-containing protein [Curtanaerobium respiraculi]